MFRLLSQPASLYLSRLLLSQLSQLKLQQRRQTQRQSNLRLRLVEQHSSKAHFRQIVHLHNKVPLRRTVRSLDPDLLIAAHQRNKVPLRQTICSLGLDLNLKTVLRQANRPKMGLLKTKRLKMAQRARETNKGNKMTQMAKNRLKKQSLMERTTQMAKNRLKKQTRMERTTQMANNRLKKQSRMERTTYLQIKERNYLQQQNNPNPTRSYVCPLSTLTNQQTSASSSRSTSARLNRYSKLISFNLSREAQRLSGGST
jgi:hypothetical protein